MMEWARVTFEQVGFHPLGFLLALLLGFLSAAASACCSLPLVGAIVGYSGAGSGNGKRAKLLGALFFMLGTILSLLVLGLVAGFVGEIAQREMGRYWKLFSGGVAILFGLSVLKLLPFKTVRRAPSREARTRGLFASALFGFLMGGGLTACSSVCCTPWVFVMMGVAMLQGHVGWGIAILMAYGVGFSLPLGALVLGVSFGSHAITERIQKAEHVIRIVAGVLLVGVGFYFFATF